MSPHAPGRSSQPLDGSGGGVSTSAIGPQAITDGMSNTGLFGERLWGSPTTRRVALGGVNSVDRERQSSRRVDGEEMNSGDFQGSMNVLNACKNLARTSAASPPPDRSDLDHTPTPKASIFDRYFHFAPPNTIYLRHLPQSQETKCRDLGRFPRGHAATSNQPGA